MRTGEEEEEEHCCGTSYLVREVLHKSPHSTILRVVSPSNHQHDRGSDNDNKRTYILKTYNTIGNNNDFIRYPSPQQQNNHQQNLASTTTTTTTSSSSSISASSSSSLSLPSLERRREARLRREYEIGKLFIGSVHFVQYLGMCRCNVIYDSNGDHHDNHNNSGENNQQLYIVMEDDHSISLSSIIPSDGFNVIEFLQLAIQIVKGIDEMHQKGVINRDIKPDNIIINPKTNLIKLCDFESASTLREETPSYVYAKNLEGTLAYVSPEQTGRINRPVDYRTDFYSLGITFYQMLSGSLPFTSNDTIQLIHSHIAQEPMPLIEFVQERNSFLQTECQKSIPLPISQIVSKLLQKNCDARYQSASGLLYDLEYCLEQMQSHGYIEPFTIAQKDFTDKFNIPNKLYGREKEVKQMLEAYARVCNDGSPELLVVSGWSGVGKSSLITEIQSSIACSSGYFVSGKFDQLAKGAYSSIRQAFDSLLRCLIIEEDGREYWRKVIDEQLGANAQVVIDVLPSLENLIGKKPPVAPLGVVEAQSRFDLVFERFFACFLRPEHPIVLFLDDLQWADIPSLHMIEVLMKSSTTKHLLLIVSYRENEVNESHRVITTISEIKDSGVATTQISLQPLSLEVTHEWITDTMQSTPDKTAAFASSIYQKTHGNPFFVKMFLRSLYDERVIYHSGDHWEWDLKAVALHQSTENVVQLMVHRINQLSPPTKKVLQLASCIGNHFQLQKLELITHFNTEELMDELMPVLNSGLGYILDEEFYFGHDRIQEAAYSGLSGGEKQKIHLKLGLALLMEAPSDIEEADDIFDIADHLNKGLDALTSAIGSQEILRIVKLNTATAHRAKNSVAFSSALSYALSALRCLRLLGSDDEIWAKYHGMTFSLHQLIYQLYNLCKMDNEAETILKVLLERASTMCEKGEVYNMEIMEKTIRNAFSDAIAIGRTALTYMGIDFPVNIEDCPAYEARETARINAIFQGKEIADVLDNLPEMTDDRMAVTFKLLNNMLVSSFLYNQSLYAVVVATAVRISLEYGRNSTTALAFSFYGGYLCSLSDPQGMYLGYRFAQSALSLCDLYHNSSLKSQVLHVSTILVNHWFQPLSTLAYHCNTAYECGLQSGDIQYAGYSRSCIMVISFFRGDCLHEVVAKANKVYGFVKRVGNVLSGTLIECYKLAALKMLDDSCPREELPFLQTENELIEEWKRRNSVYALANWYLLEVIRLYTLNPTEIEECYNKLQELHSVISFLNGHYALAMYRFFSSLLYLRMVEDLQSESGKLTKDKYDVEALLQKVSENQKVMAVYKGNCPSNFNHKFLLVEAERKRIEGTCNPFELMHLYDTAAEEAAENGFAVETCISNELAYQYWTTRKDKENVAMGYLETACVSYTRWGTTQKALSLKISSPNVSKSYSLSSASIQNTGTMSIVGAILDLDMIMKASHVISSTIDMDKLLLNILKMLIEYAGAQKGCIILDGKVEAEYKHTSSYGRFHSDNIEILKSIPIEQWENGCYEIIQRVRQTNETIVLNCACQEGPYESNPYIRKNNVKSVMCMPVSQQSNPTMLYLENNIISGAFHEQRMRILSILTSQMAISLENAKYFKAQIDAAEKIAEVQKARALEAESYRRKQDELTDRICHEIRNPLNGVFGNLDLLKMNADQLRSLVINIPNFDYTDTLRVIDEMMESVESIELCAQHQKVITDDVLTLSKLDARQIELDIKPFNPNELIQSTIKMFEAPITKKELKTDIHWLKENVTLLCDPHRIIQALVNLVSNSVKFTSKGTITVKCRLIPIEDAKNQVLLEYSIQDTGVGMSERELKNIFNPFKQGNHRVYSEYGGSGLGLFITKELVQLMGGEMSVASEEHLGTTFTFTVRCEIPEETDSSKRAIKSNEENKDQMISPPTPIIHQPLTILVAEDNPINQKILLRMLQQAGHRTLVAENGREAVNILEREKNIDLILMDIEMPVMSGLEATRIIRAREAQNSAKDAKRTVIIGISGNARREHVNRAMTAGMDDYLTKPVNRKDVIDKIMKHCL